MTATAAFIAGDWGTSNLRVALCDDAGRPMEVLRGPGAAESRGRFAEVLDGLIASWRQRHELPILLCGMAGSVFGWQEAPYVACPAELGDLVDGLVSPRPGVHIAPGMECTNPLGAPDVMRGEETQLLGAVAGQIAPGMEVGHQLVCMPGTHTKWVSLHNGSVQEFLTVPTGELFALLCEHSVIVRDRATPMSHHQAEFERGLAEAARHPDIPVLHKIFQARTLRLDRQLSAEGAASWMSGLLIGSDVSGTMKLFEPPARGPVYIIGSTQLADAYSAALISAGHAAQRVDGEAAAFAGLAVLHRQLAPRTEAT